MEDSEVDKQIPTVPLTREEEALATEVANVRKAERIKGDTVKKAIIYPANTPDQGKPLADKDD